MEYKESILVSVVVEYMMSTCKESKASVGDVHPWDFLFIHY